MNESPWRLPAWPGGTCPAGCFSVLSADGRKIGKIIVFVSVGNGF